MNVTFRTSVGGVPFFVSSRGPIDERRVRERYAPHAALGGQEDHEALHVEHAADPGFRSPRAPRRPYPAASVERLGDRFLFFRSDFELVLDPGARRATCRSGGAEGAGLDGALRVLASFELPRRDGLLLHACGVFGEREGVIFPGAGGAGKTTLARRLPPERVLSDDIVALRRHEGRWCAYSTPFVGAWDRAPVPRRAPLHAVCPLEQSRCDQLVPLVGASRLAAVMEHVVYFAADVEGLARVLELGVDLVERVPVLRLELTREGEIWPLLRRELLEEG